MCCIIAHRSPPVDQQNSASTVRTNLLKDSLIGTKKAKIMADSKIVLPSSDVNEYTGIALRSTISHIVNPTRKLLSLFPT